MKKLVPYDAKTKLPEILPRVEAGGRFTITNRGKPVADLIPSQSGIGHRVDNAIANILKARQHIVPDEALSEFKNADRK